MASARTCSGHDSSRTHGHKESRTRNHQDREREVMSHLQLDQAEILIDLAQQKLYLPKYDKQYLISTGKNGIGETENSGKTPRGWHKVAEKFGQQAPLNS